MTLTLGDILRSDGIEPASALAIRHAFVVEHEDTGLPGINADSTGPEILEYTRRQSARPRVFPSVPPALWVVFVREGGDRARLWSVVENHGEIGNDGQLRTFDLIGSDHLADLRSRLVIGWRSPRTWWLTGTTSGGYPVMEIADANPERFPGFDRLVLDHAKLQAVIREHHYSEWRTALATVVGIYLITDISDGRQYVGKADGEETILQRWRAYAANGHGNNVELRGLDPSRFRFSLLRVFDRWTATRVIDEAESYYKVALDSRRPHGLNRN